METRQQIGHRVAMCALSVAAIAIIDHLGSVLFAFSGTCAERPLYNDGWSFGDLWTYDFEAGA